MCSIDIMALVAYDCSDSSDSEDFVEETDKVRNVGEIILLEKNKEPKKCIDKPGSIECEINKNVADITLFDEKLKDSSKKSNENISEENKKIPLQPVVEITSNLNVISWELLGKNRTQPIRISIPSLDNDKDIEEPKPKLKPSSSKSGLFALLPKPKQQLFTPQSLNLKIQQQKKPIVKKAILNPFKSDTKNPDPMQPSSSNINEEDDEVVEEQSNSFFFLSDKKPVEEYKDDFLKRLDEMKEQENLKSISAEGNHDVHIESNQVDPDTINESLTNTLENETIELDNEALQKLCGRRSGKRLAGDIEMVNVNGAELVGDSKLWLSKELTTQKSHFKRSKFDPMQRRKHQITFLAAHAREQELELSNQWANNRITRKQTQAKYGF